jgi:hypothetical protein
MDNNKWFDSEKQNIVDKDYKKVKLLVLVRQNSTGEIRPYTDDRGLVNRESNELCSYVWREGNYSCDCNRRNFFEPTFELPYENHCSDNLFSVRIVNPCTGNIEYDEFINFDLTGENCEK